PSVLNSEAYVGRLNDPTPWTLAAMASFRNMVRTVCEVKAAAGDLIGAYAVVLRADAAMAPTPAAAAWGAAFAGEAGIARGALWLRAAEQTRTDAAEMQSRAKDRLAAGALVVECLRRTDADRVMAALKAAPPALGISGGTALGIYALLCLYHPAR